MKSKKVSQEDLKKAPTLHWQMVRSRATWAAQDAALAEHGLDTLGALSVRVGIFLKGFLWGFWAAQWRLVLQSRRHDGSTFLDYLESVPEGFG